MIRASISAPSSSSKRVPLTVPAVPTGMKTGVSITARRVVSVAERSWPSVARISKSRALSINDGVFDFYVVLQTESASQKNQTPHAVDFRDGAGRRNADLLFRRK